MLPTHISYLIQTCETQSKKSQVDPIWYGYVHYFAERQLIGGSRIVCVISSCYDKRKYNFSICPNAPSDIEEDELSPDL